MLNKYIKISAVSLYIFLTTLAGCSVSGGKTEDAAALDGKVSPTAAAESISGSGIYAGQADSNFIEIQTRGIQDENPYDIFMLSKELKAKFSSLGLKTGDEVTLCYYIDDNAQKVITAISKK
jgi:hypothetical protein